MYFYPALHSTRNGANLAGWLPRQPAAWRLWAAHLSDQTRPGAGWRNEIEIQREDRRRNFSPASFLLAAEPALGPTGNWLGRASPIQCQQKGARSQRPQLGREMPEAPDRADQVRRGRVNNVNFLLGPEQQVSLAANRPSHFPLAFSRPAAAIGSNGVRSGRPAGSPLCSAANGSQQPVARRDAAAESQSRFPIGSRRDQGSGRREGSKYTLCGPRDVSQTCDHLQSNRWPQGRPFAATCFRLAGFALSIEIIGTL